MTALVVADCSARIWSVTIHFPITYRNCSHRLAAPAEIDRNWVRIHTSSRCPTTAARGEGRPKPFITHIPKPFSRFGFGTLDQPPAPRPFAGKQMVAQRTEERRCRKRK